MKYKFIHVSILITILVLVLSCKKNTKPLNITFDTKSSKLNNISDDAINELSGKRIFFGHQSVGYDILEGVELLKKDFPILANIKIIEIKDTVILKDSTFIHTRIGINRYPEQKINAFINYIDSVLHGQIDIAFLKFCYADIYRGINVNKVFDYYKKSIIDLKEKYPHIKFLHLTVPVKVNKKGIKSKINGILGRSHNLKREKYNSLIREYYDEKEVYDLARIEFTYPDGDIEKGFPNVKGLIPAYTYDGGHLNELGSRKVAEEFIFKLIQLLEYDL